MAKKYRIEIWCNDDVCVLELDPEVCTKLEAASVQPQELVDGIGELLMGAILEVVPPHHGDKPHHGDI